MKTVWIVFLKEVRENLRDRRTVINTLVVAPLMAPLLFVLLINTMVTRELERIDKPLPVPVIGAEHAPQLIKALERAGALIEEGPDDPERAVREQEVDVVLRIDAGYGQAWRDGKPAQVELIYDASQRDSGTPRARLQAMVEAHSQQTSALRLLARGIAPEVVRPVVVAGRDQSTAQNRAAFMFMMLPYFFVLGAFIGGMALAIDTTAGERERQSLEPLFVNPVKRGTILAGKLSATSAFAFVTLLLSIIAFAIAAGFMPTEKLGTSLQLGLRFTIWTLISMLPLVVLLSALQTLVAAFAKSYREAQTYLSLLMIVPALPSILVSMLPMKAQAWMYGVPVMGQTLVILRLLRGDTVASVNMASCLLGTTVAAVVVCWITARIYNSERLAISA